jgi:hypothetical protein
MFTLAIHEFDVSVTKYPSLKRISSGADLSPNLKNPENPIQGLAASPPRTKAGGG